MSHLAEILVHRCIDCGKKATHELRGSDNAVLNYYCKRDGEHALEELWVKEWGDSRK